MFLNYKNCIPGYELWAKRGRQWVSNLAATRPRDQIRALNAANQAAVESFHLSLQRVEEQFSSMKIGVSELKQQVSSLNSSHETLQNEVDSLRQTIVSLNKNIQRLV